MASPGVPTATTFVPSLAQKKLQANAIIAEFVVDNDYLRHATPPWAAAWCEGLPTTFRCRIFVLAVAEVRGNFPRGCALPEPGVGSTPSNYRLNDPCTVLRGVIATKFIVQTAHLRQIDAPPDGIGDSCLPLINWTMDMVCAGVVHVPNFVLPHATATF